MLPEIGLTPSYSDYSSDTSEDEGSFAEPVFASGSQAMGAEGGEVVSGGLPIHTRKIAPHKAGISAKPQPVAREIPPLSFEGPDAEKGVRFLEMYPASELPRLLVDGVLLNMEGGYEKYEKREPGCLDGLQKAWAIVAQKLTQLTPDSSPPISIGLLKQLHEYIGAHDKAYFQPGKLYKRPFGRMTPAIGHDCIDRIYCTPKGLEEAEAYYHSSIERWGRTPPDSPTDRLCFAISLRIEGAKVLLYLSKDTVLRILDARADKDKISEVIQDYFDDHDLDDHIHIFLDILEKSVREYYQRLRHSGGELHEGSPSCDTGQEQTEEVLTYQMYADFIADSISDNLYQAIKWCNIPGQFIELETQHILTSLEHELGKCTTEEHFFEALCTAIDNLQKTHPFYSANGRTLTLFMQYILMAYGYPPATFYDPNVFYLSTLKEEVKALKEGIKASETLLKADCIPFQAGLLLHGFQSPGNDRLAKEFKARLDKAMEGTQESGKLMEPVECTDDVPFTGKGLC